MPSSMAFTASGERLRSYGRAAHNCHKDAPVKVVNGHSVRVWKDWDVKALDIQGRPEHGEAVDNVGPLIIVHSGKGRYPFT